MRDIRAASGEAASNVGVGRRSSSNARATYGSRLLILRWHADVVLPFVFPYGFLSKRETARSLVDTRLWKTKHSRKRFQKFPSIIRVIDMSDRNPLITATSVTFYVMLADCDCWISIRHVDNTYDWRKFWKRFRECFVFQSRVSTKTVVNGIFCVLSWKPSRKYVVLERGFSSG